MKICGLKTPQDINAASKAGAAYVGFVFYQKSPRSITAEVARSLAIITPSGIAKVGLMVDFSDDQLDHIVQTVPLDMIQLHGHESPQRVAQIRNRYGLPVMKAISIADKTDLAKIQEYSLVADQILIDAKPTKKTDLPGGNGLPFDWSLVANRRWLKPWMLAGGLTSDNIMQAIKLTRARQVDVSSGVESAPGIKDPQKITAFMNASQL